MYGYDAHIHCMCLDVYICIYMLYESVGVFVYTIELHAAFARNFRNHIRILQFRTLEAVACLAYRQFGSSHLGFGFGTRVAPALKPLEQESESEFRHQMSGTAFGEDWMLYSWESGQFQFGSWRP